MAPTIQLASQGPIYFNTRRTVDPHCYGWDCLSEAGQAGVIIMIIFSAGLGWYMWRRLGQPEEYPSRRLSITASLASLAGLSRAGTPFGRRQSRPLSGSIYHRNNRFSDSIHRRSQSGAISLERIREERERPPGESESSNNPHRPSSVRIETVRVVDENHQRPVIPPPPGPAPILWSFGPTPVFVHPPAYPLNPSNGGRANEIRFSSAAGQPATFQPYPVQFPPFQYGPGPIPPFPNVIGMPPNINPNGPVSPPNQGAGVQTTEDNPTNKSKPGAPDRPSGDRRRSWFPFFNHKRPSAGHARSISDSAVSSRQPPSPPELSDLRLPPMTERDGDRLRHQPSIRLIDRSPSPQRQLSPRPYPRVGYRNEFPDHILDDHSDHSEGLIHPSELSFQSVGTSMRVHDGIPPSEANSSALNRDPHFEEHSPERRRQRSLKRFRNPTRGDESNADDEDGGISAFASHKRKRHQGQRPFSTSALPSVPPSPPSSDIQFPSPESQRVTFAEPRRERGGERGRRRRERTPAPRGVRERSGERSPVEYDGYESPELTPRRRRRERSRERLSAPRQRDQSRERSRERTGARRHRNRSRQRSPTPRHRNQPRERSSISHESSAERTPPHHRTRPHERGRVQHARENHRSRNNLLGRLRAFRMETRGERY
ncbi:hypothetical protein QBC41DRAFT_104782 [Cercophora samala]|uniref:Uncharacterized protein n=1 Tax=Cercophora samala TaxID=330535 RepID=A0AA39ZMK7_9PEZI|nr:hypothetical protein QBC41DRAFT_104782 [Cercophora samala]